jgi:hypothetical protein
MTKMIQKIEGKKERERNNQMRFYLCSIELVQTQDACPFAQYCLAPFLRWIAA